MTLPALSEAFLHLSAEIEKHATEQASIKLMKQLLGNCQKLEEAEKSKAIQSLLAQVKQVLETWLQVWPRLAPQNDFRLAVAREARAWANRLK